MSKLFRFIIMAAVAVGTGSAATAGELRLAIANGRVTLTATDVPVRQILQEWTRVGGTTIVGADKLVGQNVTLQFIDQPEREALEILLKSAAGYVASQRAQLVPTASVFDRIMILPTSRAPAFSASAPPAAFSRPQPQPQPQPDDDEPVEPVPLAPGQAPPGATVSPQPGMQPMQPGMPGAAPPVQGAPAQLPMTSKTPGMLPATPNTPNPFGVPPGAVPANPNGRGGGPGGPGGPGGGPGTL